MQRETQIACVPIWINDDVLHIGNSASQGGIHDRSFHRTHAPALIAFIQAWIDHDPEQELREKVQQIRDTSGRISWQNEADLVIAAVREHDAKYRKEV